MIWVVGALFAIGVVGFVGGMCRWLYENPPEVDW